MTLIKNAWVTVLTFTQVGHPSTSYDFAGANTNILGWDPQVERRGSSRPRMQMHGLHGRPSVYDGLLINHEGVFGPADSQLAVIQERDALIAAIFGDLSASPLDDLSIGTLTVKYLGWSETASAPVTLAAAPQFAFKGDDVLTLGYQIQWQCDTPYFTGDVSGDPVLL